MRWLGLVLLLALAFGAGPTVANDDEELAAWRQRLDASQAEVTKAEQRAAATEIAYVNMRHDRSIRGDEKAKIIAARSSTKLELAEARSRFDAVREEARRAGAPPEWVLPNPSDAPADDL